jgi:hypothetical protein
METNGRQETASDMADAKSETLGSQLQPVPEPQPQPVSQTEAKPPEDKSMAKKAAKGNKKAAKYKNKGPSDSTVSVAGLVTVLTAVEDQKNKKADEAAEAAKKDDEAVKAVKEALTVARDAAVAAGDAATTSETEAKKAAITTGDVAKQAAKAAKTASEQAENAAGQATSAVAKARTEEAKVVDAHKKKKAAIDLSDTIEAETQALSHKDRAKRAAALARKFADEKEPK